MHLISHLRKASLAHCVVQGALACALALIGSTSHAARPMETEEASLLDINACQLEIWLQRNRTSTEYWAQPSCNIAGYADLVVGAARVRNTGDANHSISVVQAKFLFRAVDDRQSGWGLLLGAERSRALHRNSIGNPFASVIATFPLRGEAVLLHANAGWMRERDDLEQTSRDRTTWALALDSQVAGSTRLSVETFGQNRERPQVQLGLRHEMVPGRVQLDGSVGTRIGRGSQERYFTVGLVFFTPELFR